MDEGVVEAQCTLESCKNERANLKILIARTKRQTNDLQNFSKIQAENEVLKMKLVSTEDFLKTWTTKATEAVNAKEMAQAELKQNQSDTEYYRKKVEMLQEKADEAEKHKEQANLWREKYDSICALTEKLEANNIDVKSKYEATVKTLESVGKKMLSHQNTITTLKAEKSDSVQKQKKLDKYLKSAIQVIDSLSQRTQLNRQPKAIRDLVDIFRRDDVRLFFNSEPWNTANSQPSTSNAPDDSDDAGPSDVLIVAPPVKTGRTLSDDEEMGEEKIDRAVKKLGKIVNTQITRPYKRPDFAQKMQELEARKSAPKLLKVPEVSNKWPNDLRRPEVEDHGALVNTHTTHTKTVPTSDFDVIANAAETRKKALLGAHDSVAASSTTTIHGKKGKTVREQQLDMMKKETVREKAARMRAEAAGEAAPAAEDKKIEAPSVSLNVARARYESFKMSEMGSDSEEEGEMSPVEQKHPGPRGRGRQRAAVVLRVPTPPKMESQPTPIRRSSRLSTMSSEASEVSKPRPRGRPRTISTASGSPTPSRSRSRQRSHSIVSNTSREERARARSVLRGEEDAQSAASSVSASMTPVMKTAGSKEESVGDVVRRGLGMDSKKRAAPAPVNSGPPLRTRRMEKMKAPIVIKKTSPEDAKALIATKHDDGVGSSRAEAGSEEVDSVPDYVGPPERSKVLTTTSVKIESDSDDGDEEERKENESSSDSDDSDIIIMAEDNNQIAFGPNDPYVLAAMNAVDRGTPELVELDSSSDMSNLMVDDGPAASDAVGSIFEKVEADQSPASAPKVMETPELVASVLEKQVHIPEVIRTESVASQDMIGPEPELITPNKFETDLVFPNKPAESTERPKISLDVLSKPVETSMSLKSPKQIIVSKYGLDISDSEEEDDGDTLQICEGPTSSNVKKDPTTLTLVEADSMSTVSQPASNPEELKTDKGLAEKTSIPTPEDEKFTASPALASVTKTGESLNVQSPPFPGPNTPTQPILTRATSYSASTSSRSRPENWNSHDDLIAKIISGDTGKKALKATKPVPVKSIKSEGSAPNQNPSSKNPEDDLLADILSGAKAFTQKKPAVQKRVTPSTAAVAPTPSADVPSMAECSIKEDASKTLKRQAPLSTFEENPPKRQYTKKASGVQLIDPVPLKRVRSVRKASEDVPTASAEPTTSEVTKSDSAPIESTKKGPNKTILIEAPTRPRGRNIKVEQKPLGLKEAIAKNVEKGGKKINKFKTHFRQALDLKLPVTELKRPMEEKGVSLDNSIPLTPSDAVDVMMEFLRESSAGDMWAVLNRQRVDANTTPLMNTEEQNFLNVSVSLNDNHKLLLHTFIGRILYEISLRDSIDSKQCGRLVRLFCHAIRFAEYIPSEDSEKNPPDDVEALIHEKKSTWMRCLIMVLLHKHPTQLMKSFAYCLISDASEFCQFVVEELEKDPMMSEFHYAFRILLHKESEQAAVINWLLSAKFQMAYVMNLSPEEITTACTVAHQKFIEDSCSLKMSTFLAKCGAPEVLGVAFKLLKEQMELVERQFLDPKEKEKELKHKTIFSVPTIATKMSTSDAMIFKKEAEWQKTVLLIMIDNPTSRHYESIMKALATISVQVVTFREIVDSSDVENFVESQSGVDYLREAVQHLLDLISDFTNFPLKPSVLPATEQQ